MVDRIKVNDYQALGRKFIQWARNPQDPTKPTDLASFKRELVDTGILQLPKREDGVTEYYTAFQWAPPVPQYTLQLRLPPKELVDQTYNSLKVLPDIPGYVPPAPPQNGYGPEGYLMDPKLREFYGKSLGGYMSGQNVFQFRIGDYVIAHCA
jgi:hypothetical protein